MRAFCVRRKRAAAVPGSLVGLPILATGLSVLVTGLSVLATGLWAAPASAVKAELGGLYGLWYISQHNFFFGAKDENFGSDGDNYVVQVLRLNLSLADDNDDIKVMTRVDLAQGWWGVDNAGDHSANYGQFREKSTFFDLHVDHAYLDFRLPHTEARIMVGRFNHRVGNRLVLDDDMDGIKLSVPLETAIGKFGLNLAFTIPSEGGPWSAVSEDYNTIDSLNDEGDNDDARMVSVTVNSKFEEMGGVSVWYIFYDDASGGNGTPYITAGLGYARPRFTPQVNRLNIIGASAEYEVGALRLKGEVDYLTGNDDISNTTYNGNANDINDGCLDGYTAYVDANWSLSKGNNVGVKFGIGSGDSDPTGGRGNITKLKTQGFFYFTEVWEDSIMPDVAGITPQGIGAPNTRGYREFENTTAFQIYGNYAITDSVLLHGSYSYMMATEDVHGWDADGPTAEVADDIGQEFDFVLAWKIYERLGVALRGGYFLVGDAARLLVNGDTLNRRNAWEIKPTLLFRF